MAKEPDAFAKMTDRERASAMGAMALTLLGPHYGKVFVDQMKAAMKSKVRQVGDAPEPEKNYWKGAWRIYELD